VLYTQQTTAAQTAFASLASVSLLETVRSIANLPGSFLLKNIKSKPYWYYQTPDLTGGQSQIFIGRATAELTAPIDIHRNGGGSRPHLKQLAQQAMAVGCPYIATTHTKIIARRSDAGLLVLQLGCRKGWQKSTLKMAVSTVEYAQAATIPIAKSVYSALLR
jgi:hypothetical protein